MKYRVGHSTDRYKSDSVLVFISRTTYSKLIKSPSAIVMNDDVLDEINENVINEDDVFVILNGLKVYRATSKRRRFDINELWIDILESCVFGFEHLCDSDLQTNEDAERMSKIVTRWQTFKKNRGY